MNAGQHKKTIGRFCLFLFLILVIHIPVAHADACTYGDGVLAYEKGNLMRAVTLLTMAKNDGDERAGVFLAEHLVVRPKINHSLPQQILLKTEQVAVIQ